MDVGGVSPARRLKLEHDRLPGGSATLDLMEMADEGKRLKIRDALLKLLSYSPPGGHGMADAGLS